jgi:hypothetical protein
MRQNGDAATWTIGRDDASRAYTAFYSDARGVSRIYEMTLADGVWRIWRDNRDFSQRFEATVSGDGDTISGHWEKRSTGADWEHDFDLTYRRLRGAA